MLRSLQWPMGVTSALLILLGGAYLFWTKTANRSLIVTTVLVYAAWTQAAHLAGFAATQKQDKE